MRDPGLVIQAAPFLRQGTTTPGLMRDVIIGLVPVVAAALWYFGLKGALVLLTATASAVATEWVFSRSSPRSEVLWDGSAALTGLLLGLTLPPAFPLWMAALGGVVAIGMGKVMFGGLGSNLFNPALVGRAFLQAAFPTAITTWADPTAGQLGSMSRRLFTVPFGQPAVDAISSATPLGAMKFEHRIADSIDLLTGNVGGSLGETSALLIIVCGLWLAWRRTFDWRIPSAILLTVAALSTLMYAIGPDRYPPPQFMLMSGGLLFGAVYMATDPVTSPTTPRGAWVFGAGIGILVVLIRLWGGLPEGVMYAILLMNAANPLIERASQPRPFGRGGAR